MKIIPVECVVKFGPTFWMAGCKILSAALYLELCFVQKLPLGFPDMFAGRNQRQVVSKS